MLLLRLPLITLGLSILPEPHGYEWLGWLVIMITILL